MIIKTKKGNVVIKALDLRKIERTAMVELLTIAALSSLFVSSTILGLLFLSIR